MPGPFNFSSEVRVRLSETDAFGIVFHANFYVYFAVAQMDYMRSLGMIDFMRPVAGATSAVVHASANFRSPARFDDVLVVQARVAEIGRTSFTMEYRAVHKAEQREVADGKTVLVCLDEKTWRPVPVPEAFRAKIRAFEGAGLVERRQAGTPQA